MWFSGCITEIRALDTCGGVTDAVDGTVFRGRDCGMRPHGSRVSACADRCDTGGNKASGCSMLPGGSMNSGCV